jgi:hypothetical protein
MLDTGAHCCDLPGRCGLTLGAFFSFVLLATLSSGRSLRRVV